jgi:NAD-dependent deacetylase
MQAQIIIFSGAGMSAESGIKTFRDSNGLWENYNIHDVATPEAWKHNPDLVTDFYNQRRKQIINSKPNEAHFAIAELEKKAEVQIITQNIDDLHERAGSKDVLHLHGNIRYAKSSGPNQEKEYYPVDGWKLSENDKCPEGFRLRPHVVWFGENVPMMERAIDLMVCATHFIVIGSSLQVYPAANLLSFCPPHAQKWIIDPKADELNDGNEFRLINQKAVDGIQSLMKELRL